MIDPSGVHIATPNRQGGPVADDSDKDLVKRATEGDESALAMLLTRFGPQVRRKLTVSPTWQSVIDPADVMQVTYMEACLRIRQLKSQEPEAFLTWLTRMAENNLRDAIRELECAKRPSPRQRVQPMSQEESAVMLLEAMGCTTATASRHAAARESVGLLDEAIDQLPESYRSVVRLFDLECKSVQEVSEAIGRSPAAVYMLRIRAHDRLRELLGSQSKFFSDRA